MSSSSMSKRLCTVLPRQTRALSLSLYPSHLSLDAPPLPPYARPTPVVSARHPSPAPTSPTQPSSSSPPSSAPPQTSPLPPLPSIQSIHPQTLPAALPPPPLFLCPTFIPHPSVYSSPHIPRPTLRLAAAAHGIPKRRPHRPPPTPDLGLDLDLATQVGEDAYFLRPDALGVADGVGGWGARGSSALFARALMHFCAADPPAHAPAPVAVLQRAYDRCIAAFRRAGITGGSATALLAVLRDEELRIAHLGDCAVCVVRAGGIVYRSEEMQHAFNHPLQLGPASPTLPAHARAISLRVQRDDIVILATDGMADNLWDEDVEEEVRRFHAAAGQNHDRPHAPFTPTLRQSLPRLLAQALCSRAYRASVGRPSRSRTEAQDRGKTDGEERGAADASADAEERGAADASVDAEVPFARRAREEGIRFVGGKCDDISVLVAVVSPARTGAGE